jgi:hypothetical protein
MKLFGQKVKIDPFDYFAQMALLTAVVKKYGGCITISAEELLDASDTPFGYSAVPRNGGKPVDYILRTGEGVK